MSWINQLKSDPTSSLLNSPEPAVRYLAMRLLLDMPADHPDLVSVRSASYQSGPIADILSFMDPAGYWGAPGPGYGQKYRSGVWTITYLAQLGAHISADPRLQVACEYILDHALTPNGQFTTSGAPSGTIDCLQGNLCWALSTMGCQDLRLEKAYEWMACSTTGEGVASKAEKNAPIRYYSTKCGPGFACGSNGGLACGWGAVKVMLAFSALPNEKRTPLILEAIDQGIAFLLESDLLKCAYPTWTGNKPSQNWWKLGFPVFYITDLLQSLEALTGLGYGTDRRLSSALDWLREKQIPGGGWAQEYDYNGKSWINLGEKKKDSPWVTLRALRVLKAAS